MDIRNPVPTVYGDWWARFGETWKSQVAQLKEQLGDSILQVRMPIEYATDVPIIYVKKNVVVGLLRLLKDTAEFSYDFLSDITATDEHPSNPRFEVVYNLYSIQKKTRIRVKVRLGEDEEIPTATDVWPGANWAEREVWDMFGIRFQGHPDLRRILMDVRWKGHPLRKDYPLRGYQVFTTPEQIDEKLLDD